MTKAQLYRECAADCLWLSERATRLTDRLRLICMADEWRRLAMAFERLLGAAEPAVPQSALVQEGRLIH
jgi:hypothetical protein